MAAGPGRPSKYDPAFCEQARKLCLLGATDVELADFFEVAPRSIARWQVEHEEFRQSLKSGKEQADNRVARSLFHRAMGYSHDAVKIFNTGGEIVRAGYREHYPPDTTAAIFWLKNRKPAEWRDRIENHTTIAADDTIAGLLGRVATAGRRIHDKPEKN